MNFQNEFFEKSAKKYPNYIAVDDHGKKITYKNLDIYANKIANFLSKLGCSFNDRVCIFTEKNINQYASILGILKSGACWVPLSYLFPKQRLFFLIKDINPKVIITEKKYLNKILKFRNKCKFIVLDSNKKFGKNFFSKNYILKEKKTKPRLYNLSSSNLAYIIFTSGSTGKPKGVMVTHENTSQFLSHSKKYFKPKTQLRFAHISELTFDVSIFDIFICWVNAGTIIPFNKKHYRINPFAFFSNNKYINAMFVVPSFFKKLNDIEKFNSKELSKLKHIVLGGEAIPNGLISNWYNSNKSSSVYNVYGTTETAIISHWHKILKKTKDNDNIPVGKSLPNVQVLLLENSKISNKSGEVLVCGPQISPGYWNNLFQTNQYFIPHPEEKKIPQKFYRTGDKLFKDSDGLYYFVGRTDNQVKIRGHRVELEELENCVKNIQGITDATTLAYSRTGKTIDLELFSFIISNSKKVTKNKILNFIENNLPKYMLPSGVFIRESDFPRTQNGKINKKELIKDILKNIY